MRCAMTLVFAFAGCSFVFADEPPKPPEPVLFEVRLADGSAVKAAVTDGKIDIQTRYGKLTIPFADVQKIEIGPRLTAEAVKKLEAAVANLNSATESVRESAADELLKAGVAAVPPLTNASKGPSAELAAKARDMLERLHESLGQDRTAIHTEDAIYTEGFTVVGKIETSSIRIRTGHFGELTLRIPDIRSVRAPNFEGDSATVLNALPDPGSMSNYNNQIGKTFYFTVTGTNNGSLYGTGIYTTDSTVSTAAVHLGILKVGQTGVVKVVMVASPQQYTGTTQNGITSSNWGVYPAAFKISKP